MNNHEGKQLKSAVKKSNLGVNEFLELFGGSRSNLYYYFNKEQLTADIKIKAANILGVNVTNIWPQGVDVSNMNQVEDAPMRYQTIGDEMRFQKAFGDKQDEGLLYVPVAAQAGYAKHLTEPVYLYQLKRWKIPDFPYKGDKYRIFEVEGDSMTYSDGDGRIRGLMEGYQVIGERVEQEDWKYSTQWYVHILVFDDRLTIKRLYRDDSTETFVLISDNPDYPQKRIPMSEVKELWVMKRFMGWDMSPPKKYDLTV